MSIFDKVHDRSNTDSLKYDFPEKYGRPPGSIPLWVADMDFPAPPAVLAAIKKVTDHGIYGYTETKDDYFKAVANWFLTEHNYKVKNEWMVKTPGVVYALGLAIKAFTNPGDAIVIQKPLYYPIEGTILANNRVMVDNPLVYADGRYSLDLKGFEQKIINSNARMFILCNPHNPVGRVWTFEELLAMGRICQKHNCLVVSDEIHCDIVFKGHKHIVFSTVCEEFEDFSIICTAPSKTFNLAGLQVANTFIPNEELRKRYTHEMLATGYHQLNTVGLAACKAAYLHGHQWRTELLAYLDENVAFVRDYLADNLPLIRPVPLEGTYLLWLDFNGLGLSHDELVAWLDRCKVWLSSGVFFGDAGAGFFRVNLACSRSVLERAFERIDNL